MYPRATPFQISKYATDVSALCWYDYSDEFLPNFYHLHNEDGIVFSNVRLFVRMSVNAITPEPLEVSSRNFRGMVERADKFRNGYIGDWGCMGDD